MATLEIETTNFDTFAATNHSYKHITKAGDDGDEDELSPIEEVRLTVANTDDPTLPVRTFQIWTLGLLSYSLLSFLNQFFSYRTEPLIITQITILVASLPIGRFMATTLPRKQFRIPGFGSRLFSLNPGLLNMKEHVLINIFANARTAFGNGPTYAVGIVDIIKAFYHRNISFVVGWLLIITTQVTLAILSNIDQNPLPGFRIRFLSFQMQERLRMLSALEAIRRSAIIFLILMGNKRV